MDVLQIASSLALVLFILIPEDIQESNGLDDVSMYFEFR